VRWTDQGQHWSGIHCRHHRYHLHVAHLGNGVVPPVASIDSSRVPLVDPYPLPPSASGVALGACLNYGPWLGPKRAFILKMENWKGRGG
ncbi:unnamed protein product, partial [Discosporangium mesarthrocarpum]